MGFDAMANDTSVPAIARDIGKKKRANRSARLKQCKLDARREQWLSQVKNKGCKDTSMGTSPASPPPHPSPRTGQGISEAGSAEREGRERDGLALQDSSDVEFSPTHSPTPVSNPTRKGCPNNNSVSSGSSSIGSCSRSVSDSEEDDGEEDRGGLDDWEAVADALSVSADSQPDRPNSPDPAAVAVVHSTMTTNTHEAPCGGSMKSGADRTIRRAWRADDAFRPQSLPNLSKQRSFPVNIERHCGAAGWAAHLHHQHHQHHGILSPPPPSSCPICYEDLDLTDSSFLPCSCGFRLCLFCHKRILEADGRCPGCRKQYGSNPVVVGEMVVNDGGLLPPPSSYRLSRSCSMSPRS